MRRVNESGTFKKLKGLPPKKHDGLLVPSIQFSFLYTIVCYPFLVQ